MTREWIGGLPRRMRNLPVDKRGFPTPAFVQWFDGGQPVRPGVGEPDFRVVDPVHIQGCVTRKLCWICGQPLGSKMLFVVGPMCCVNRLSAEPPCHVDCATFAALNCPFLARPLAKRNDRTPMPGETRVIGDMIEHNPGATALWCTRAYGTIARKNGWMFEMGDPEWITFYAQGRLATRAEVDASIDKGLPLLLAVAERIGPVEVSNINQQRDKFEKMFDRMAVY